MLISRGIIHHQHQMVTRNMHTFIIHNNTTKDEYVLEYK